MVNVLGKSGAVWHGALFVLYSGKHPIRTQNERKGEQDIAIVVRKVGACRLPEMHRKPAAMK